MTDRDYLRQFLATEPETPLLAALLVAGLGVLCGMAVWALVAVVKHFI